MKLRMTFNNTTPAVEFQTTDKIMTSKPIELVVEGGGKTSRAEALTLYLRQFDYMYRCVKNVVNPAFGEIEQIGAGLLTYYKNSDNVKIKQFDDELEENEKLKYNTVIYDLAGGEVVEKMYMTSNGITQITYHNKSDSILTAQDEYGNILKMNEIKALNYNRDEYGNILNETVFATSDALNGGKPPINILKVIALVETYLNPYHLVWEDNKLVLKNKEGTNIMFGAIARPPVYTFFKLLTLLLQKGRHTGVFYIRCDTFNTNELKALISLIYLVFGSTALIWVYKCEGIDHSKINMDCCKLPNFLIYD